MAEPEVLMSQQEQGPATLRQITQHMTAKILAARTAGDAGGNSSEGGDTEDDNEPGEVIPRPPQEELDDSSSSETPPEPTEKEVTKDDGTEEEEKEGTEKTEDEKATYSVKTAAGKQMYLPSDATILVDIDGKTIEINVQKAVEVAAQNTDFETERESIRALEVKANQEREENASVARELHTLGEAMERAIEGVKKGEGMEAYHELARLAGYENPIDWELDHIKMMWPVISQLSGMNEEQQEAWYNKRLAEVLKKDNDERRRQSDSQTSKTKLDDDIKQVRSRHGITDDEWEFATKALRQHKANGTLEKYGFDPKKLTAADAADVAVQYRISNRVDARLSANVPKLKEKVGAEKYQEQRKIWMKVLRDAHESDIEVTDAELDMMIREAAKEHIENPDDQQDAKVLGRKVKPASSSGAQKTAKQKADKPVRSFAEMRDYLSRVRGQL